MEPQVVHHCDLSGEAFDDRYHLAPTQRDFLVTRETIHGNRGRIDNEPKPVRRVNYSSQAKGEHMRAWDASPLESIALSAVVRSPPVRMAYRFHVVLVSIS